VNDNASKSVPPSVQEVSLPVVGTDQRFPVRRIYCVGRNYVSHIREMAEADERDLPFFFQKPRDAIVENGDEVPYPQATENFEFEGELVVAIGASGSDIPVDDVDKHVFGVACGIDLTRRDLQFEARERSWPWEMGKSFDHSAPVGALTPTSTLDILDNAELTLHVDGKLRQHTSLSLMIWSTREIISRLSAQFRLEPGDIVMTGTPAGVGALGPGDRVDVAITGLEALSITVTSKA
jgi:fumarylpyruvate hydrolase